MRHLFISVLTTVLLLLICDKTATVPDGDTAVEEKIQNYCLGCLEIVNKNAKGVDELVEIALEHLESEKENRYAIIEILQVSREIKNAIKYNLDVQVMPTVCLKTDQVNRFCPLDQSKDELICRVVFEKIRPHKGHKRAIFGVTANNCTDSQEFTMTECLEQVVNDTNK